MKRVYGFLLKMHADSVDKFATCWVNRVSGK